MFQKIATRSFTSSSRALANYGFIGIGQMGQHMARHIYEQLEPSDELYIYDTASTAVEQFVKENSASTPENASKLHTVSSIEEMITASSKPLDFICTMVPEGKHVKKVAETLVETFKKTGQTIPTTIVDSSTIDIATSREVHQYVKQELPEFDFIDAPVSGGVAGARKGTLSFMLSRPDHQSISPNLTKLINKMGKNIFPCGETHGSGLAAKLSNNYLLAVTNLAVADSFQLAKSFGLDLKAYAKLVAVSTGKSWASVDNCPIPGVYPEEMQLPADVQYKGGFVTKLTRKDLVLATQCAQQNNRSLFLGDVSRAWYDKACEDENIANRDLSVLYEWLENLDTKKGV